MKPANRSVTAQNAEQRVRVAVEQVKVTEKKARAAKEKVWRAKLLFKLARRASRKAKKAVKRARAKAVQAQITLKELTERIMPAKRLTARTSQSAPTPRRIAPSQSFTEAKRKRPAGVSMVGFKPDGASTPQRAGRTNADAKPMQADAGARSARRRSPAIEVMERADVESVTTQPGALDESKKPAGLGDFGDERIRAVQASPESPAGNPGS